MKFAPEQLQEDVTVLRTTFQKCHPSLYWYSPASEVDSAFESLYSSLQDSLTEQQFRLRLSGTVAHIHCGHTSVRASKAASRYREQQRTLLFPLQVKIWAHDSVVVLANAFRGDSSLVRGVSIHSINGRPVGDIVDTLCRFISADGLHSNFKYQLLSNNFPAWYKGIIGLSKEYILETTDRAGKDSTLTIKNFDPVFADSVLKARHRPIQFSPGQPPPKKGRLTNERKLTIDTARSLAIMELNTFTHARLSHFFRKTFRLLEQNHIQNLAIELRENGGGNIMSSTMLTRFIVDHPFKVADTVAAVSLKYPIRGLVKNGVWYTIQSWFVTSRKADGRLHYRMYEKKYFTPKRKHHFDGQVFILTGGFTFSASNLFISPIKGQKNVTVIGEETGGGAYGNSAVNIPDVRLPNTGVRVRLPLYRLVINKGLPKDGHGILPDIYVPPTSWHLAHRLDPKMMKVYELIGERRE